MTVLDESPNEVNCNHKNIPTHILQLKNITNEKLHVIMVISNPCNFKRRWQLAKEFINRLNKQPNIILYSVEVVYLDQEFKITSPGNPNHLQIRLTDPLWHKESMINSAVKNLLPKDWSKMAWVDADLEFENNNWASETCILLDHFDVVQCFSHCLDLDINGNVMNIWQGGAFQYCQGMKRGTGYNYWHCGYAWAITRTMYEKMGGLYDLSILGSGDHQMFTAWLGSSDSIPKQCQSDYKRSVEVLAQKCKGTKMGYTPGIIKHYFHGSKINRKYKERWSIVIENNFNPNQHITRDRHGIIIPTATFPKKLLTDILDYFRQRNEDEFFPE